MLKKGAAILDNIYLWTLVVTTRSVQRHIDAGRAKAYTYESQLCIERAKIQAQYWTELQLSDIVTLQVDLARQTLDDRVWRFKRPFDPTWVTFTGLAAFGISTGFSYGAIPSMMVVTALQHGYRMWSVRHAAHKYANWQDALNQVNGKV